MPSHQLSVSKVFPVPSTQFDGFVDDEMEGFYTELYTRRYSHELVFTVDLMSFVMMKVHQPFIPAVYASCLGVPPRSPFTETIEKALDAIIDSNDAEIKKIYVKLGESSYDDFKLYAMIAVKFVDLDEFDGIGFLSFCGMLTHIAALAYARGVRNAPNFTVVALCHLVRMYKTNNAFPINAWADLERAAADYVETE